MKDISNYGLSHLALSLKIRKLAAIPGFSYGAFITSQLDYCTVVNILAPAQAILNSAAHLIHASVPSQLGCIEEAYHCL